MLTNYPNGIQAFPVVGADPISTFSGLGTGVVFFVDGDYGADANDGKSPDNAKKTIQSAVTAAAAQTNDGAIIYIKARDMAAGATDPVSYAETIVIPATASRLSLIGVGNGKTQGGLPQINKGSGTAALITVRAPGVLIANLGINGVGSTGGGILLDDDGSTKTAFGTTIANCHIKNCVGTTATDSRTGGGIQWSSAGNAWQVRIQSNRFYKNVGDVVLLGTGGSVPQDVVIEDNIFSGPAANVDCNLYLAAGSGMNGLILRNNEFTAFPAIGAGSVLRFADLTGCVGMMVGNSFATSTTLTFGAAGTGAKVPTTVFMPKNYRETTTGVSSEVFRT